MSVGDRSDVMSDILTRNSEVAVATSGLMVWQESC